MTTPEMLAFVQRGYDAYNAHQTDPHWLDYTDTDVAEECEVVDVHSGMILRSPEGLKQFLLLFSTAFPDSYGEVTAIFAGEDHAVVEVILHGTHTSVLHSAAGDRQGRFGRTGRLGCAVLGQFRLGLRHLSLLVDN